MADENQPDHAKELDALKVKAEDEAKQRKQAEADLKAVYDDVLAEVPESHRDLIPATLTTADKIKWIRAAAKRGVFSEKKPDIKVDQSRPKTSPHTEINLDGLNPEALMARGYKTAHV